MDRKEQKEKGLPVYIPKGPMSQEHKDHISEGLLKYYAQKRFLEGSADFSEAEKRYFSQNPEQKQRMSKAMLYAWKTPQGRGIQKNMIKFFKKNHVQMVEIAQDIFEEQTVEQKTILKLFWAKNAWAAKEMSTAVNAG